MMQTVKLVAKKSKNGFFSMGLAIDGMKSFLDPATDGGILAHDLLEHQNGVEAIGTVHDELMALGAYWYVRGQHGQINLDVDFKSGTNPIDPMARECARQMSLTTVYGCGFGRNTAKWRSVTDEEREGPTQWDEALLNVQAQMPMYFHGSRLELLPRLDDALHYLRKGCRLADVRYGHKPWAANRTFWEIRAATNTYCASARTGEEFLLSYDTDSISAQCERTRNANRRIDPPYFASADKSFFDELMKLTRSPERKQPTAKVFKQAYTPKVYGPPSKQRNVYKEARYA